MIVGEYFSKKCLKILNVILFSVELKTTCESLEQSKWINDVCYFFHNKEVQKFNDAKKVCSDEAIKFGFSNGRLYEPRDANTFVEIYKLAEEFSKQPKLQIWLGMTDSLKEGQFTYVSDGQASKMVAPWGGKLFLCFETMCFWTYAMFLTSWMRHFQILQ